MNRTYCGSVDNKAINNNLVVNGWVNTRRDHGGVIFIDLRDHTGILQVVFNPDNKKVFEQAQNLRTEYVLEIKHKNICFQHILALIVIYTYPHVARTVPTIFCH